MTIEQVARILCKADGCNPDHSLGGDKQNFRWMEYERMARGLYEDGIVSTGVSVLVIVEL